jgi:hypothetical protein
MVTTAAPERLPVRTPLALLACPVDPATCILSPFLAKTKTFQQSTNALSVQLSSTAVEESKEGEIFS